MSNRAQRIAKNIKEELGWMLEKGEIKDPRVGFLTVTGVELSTDLRYGKIYFSLIGGPSEREDAQKGLKSASGFIKTELAHRLHLKFAPELEFKYDRSVETGARIAEILEDIRKKDETDDE